MEQYIGLDVSLKETAISVRQHGKRILMRTVTDSALRSWGQQLKAKIGFKRAAVAVARKLAVIMHAMLKSGELFDRQLSVAA